VTIVVQDFTELQRERIRYHLDWEYPLSNIFDLYPNNQESVLFAYGTYTQYFVYAVVGNFLVPPVTDNDDDYNDIYLYGERLAVPRTMLWECELALQKMSANEVDGSLIAQQAGKLKLRPDELAARLDMYQTQVARLAKHFQVYVPDKTDLYAKFGTPYR
jgi:hypothetical protein